MGKITKPKKSKEPPKYDRIIDLIFKRVFQPGSVRATFTREDLATACDDLGIPRIKNLGDIPYSYRYRRELTESIRSTALDGAEWIILGVGIGKYEFRLASPGKIQPAPHIKPIEIPDATPEIVRLYAPGTDEQALLTRARYNRIVDLFTGTTCYSIQNHLRTTLDVIGELEIDEVYIGMNKRGAHFVMPCQAKSIGDKFGIVQVIQDLAFCKYRYPNAICKPIAIQFIKENGVAVLELAVDEKDEILRLSVVEEKHYELVPRNQISSDELKRLMDNEI
jgi:hypothetical protein